MKTKTANACICKKFDAWAASIDDQDLRARVKNNTIITGGCIASMLLGEKVNDYDLYFRDHATTKAVAEYYVARFQTARQQGIPLQIKVQDVDGRISVVVKSAGVASEDGTEKPYQYFESRPEGEASGYVAEVMGDPGEIEDRYQHTETAAQEVEDATYRPVFLSTNAITLSNRVQVILRFYGAPDALHENYDFVHCTNYWDSATRSITLRPKALEALLTKELRYVGSRYPLCSLMRLRKFIARGWTVNAGQILKAVMQLQELDLKNVEVLRDQLTGVDSAYFCEVITKLRDKHPEKIESAYLIEIIDRMF